MHDKSDRQEKPEGLEDRINCFECKDGGWIWVHVGYGDVASDLCPCYPHNPNNPYFTNGKP